MATFTFDQFKRAAEDAGMYNSFSAADLALAQKNPDAGMSILSYKRDFADATTEEARALANFGAEGVRKSYGNYAGGADGSGYKLGDLSPMSFTHAPAPVYTDKYAGEIADLYEKQKNYGDYRYDAPAPVYSNRYDGQINALVGQMLNRGEFTYDAEKDPLYSQHRKTYAREGKRATADALAAASAASGGMPSSYAVTVASQAGDYYAAQMSDKIQELYQMAYDRFLREYQMKQNDIATLQGLEQADYAKYRDRLSQYNTDRSFDYGRWSDGYNRAANNLATAQGLQSEAYNRYLDALDQHNTDRNFAYGQLVDEIDRQRNERQEELSRAELAAGYGDYTPLNRMGINTDEMARQIELERAQIAAQYGDYSQLLALGVEPVDTAAADRALERAQIAAQYGDYGPLRALGIEPVIDSDTPMTKLSAEAIAAIEQMYGGKALPADAWEEILAGNQALTDEDLVAAGFTKGQMGPTMSSEASQTLYSLRRAMEQSGNTTLTDAQVEDLLARVERGMITDAELGMILDELGIGGADDTSSTKNMVKGGGGLERDRTVKVR